MEYLEKLLDSLREMGKITSIESEISYGGIPLKPLPRTYADRLLVVGDAAGQVKPTSGGGIYYGLLCADIAVATLRRALAEDNLTAAGLAAYQRGWRKRLGRELRTGYWARRLFEGLSDRRLDSLFGIVKANGIDEALLNADGTLLNGTGAEDPEGDSTVWLEPPVYSPVAFSGLGIF